MRNKKIPQWAKVLIGMFAGIMTGVIFGKEVSGLEYLGVIFLNMIKMVTIPLIFFTIIYGITSVESKSGFRKLSIKAIIVFLCTAVLAASIGIITTSIIKPGANEGKEISSIIKSMQSDGIKMQSGAHISNSIGDFIVNVVPDNVFAAAANGNILQIIVFAFFCGVMLKKNKKYCERTIDVCHEIAHMLFSMIEKIMLFAPIGVFGYMSTLIAIEGIGIIITMGKLIITIIIGCILQYFLFGIILLVFGRISPFPFYRKIADIQLLAFSTSSSKAVLVPMMKKCENELGVSKEGSRFILPLSAALNMDGGAIYQAACVIFFSQVYGIDLTMSHYVIIIVMSTVASIGGAGIPSGVLLFLGMVLHSVGMPMDGVLLIATIDRILDMFTTAINVTGDMFATLLIESRRVNKKIYYDKDL